MVQAKRVYEKSNRKDGYRVLVDNLWPRGKKKSEITMDEWAKEISPSPSLCRSSRLTRKEFGYDPKTWKEFTAEYLRELRKPNAKQKLEFLVDLAKKGNLTLLYSTNDEERNNAVVVKHLIERKLQRAMKNLD